MRFTKLHIMFLCVGFVLIIVGISRLVQTDPSSRQLVDLSSPQIQEISGGYQYTPISRREMVSDLKDGETTIISSKGRIKVNVNSSNLEELTRLPGVGRSTALRILEYRLEKGPFLRVDEMDNIKGIGPKTIQKFADQAFAGNPDHLDRSMLEKLLSEDRGKKSDQKNGTIESVPCGPGRININTANLDELISLPRIGAKTAERIIADRSENGPFKDVNDLTRVKGIGAKTLEKMKDRICAE